MFRLFLILSMFICSSVSAFDLPAGHALLIRSPSGVPIVTPDPEPEPDPPIVQVDGIYPEYTPLTVSGISWGGFEAFDPPTTNVSATPMVAAHTEWADSGESVLMSSEYDLDNLITFDGVSTNSIAATWDSAKPWGYAEMEDDGFKLAWPISGSVTGAPIAIGKADARWIAPSTVEPGESFSIYGRSLGANCKVFCDETDTWITADSSHAYKATFTAPLDWSSGSSYTLYASNGEGREYGLSEAITIKCRTALQYDSGTVNASSASYADVLTALGSAGSNYTVNIPAGTCTVTAEIVLPDYIHLNCAGTVFTPSASIVGDMMIDNGGSADFIEGKISGAVFDYGAGVVELYTLLQLDGPNSIIENCTFTFVNYDDANSIDMRPIEISGADGEFLEIRNCEFNQIGYLSLGSYLLYHSNTNNGMYDQETGRLLNINSYVQEVAFYDNVAQNYDYNSADINDWFQGRVLLVSQISRRIYYGENETINCGIHASSPHQNSGEQILFESTNIMLSDNPDAVTSNTVTFDVMNINNTPYVYWGDPTNNTQTGSQAITGFSTYYKDLYVSSWSPTPTADSDVLKIPQYAYSYKTKSGGVTSTSATFSYPINTELVGASMMVIEGKGFGQCREIVAFDRNTGTATLKKPWVIEPDANSRIGISEAVYDLVAYGNTMDSPPPLYSQISGNPVTAHAPISFYGSSWGNVFANNDCSDHRSGVNIVSRVGPQDANTFIERSGPSFWNIVEDNSFTGLYAGGALTCDLYNPYDRVEHADVALFGSVFRSNTVSESDGAYSVSDSPLSSSYTGLIMFENNSGTVSNLFVSASATNSYQIFNDSFTTY